MREFRVLLMESDTGWTVLDVDHGFVAQGKSLLGAWRKFAVAVKETIAFYKGPGLEWSEHVEPASAEYQERFDSSSSITFDDMKLMHLIGNDSDATS